MALYSALDELARLSDRAVFVAPKVPTYISSDTVKARVKGQLTGRIVKTGDVVYVRSYEGGALQLQLTLVERIPPDLPISQDTMLVVLKTEVIHVPKTPSFMDDRTWERVLLVRRFFDSDLYKKFSEGRIVRGAEDYYSKDIELWFSEKLALGLSESELSSAIKGSIYRRGQFEAGRFFRGRYYRVIEGKLETRGDWDSVRADVDKALLKYGNKARLTLLASLSLSEEVGRFTFNQLYAKLSAMRLDYYPSRLLNALEYGYRLVMTSYRSRQYHEWFVPPEMWKPIESGLSPEGGPREPPTTGPRRALEELISEFQRDS